MLILLLPLALGCHCPQADPASADPTAQAATMESELWLKVDPPQAELAPNGTAVFRVNLNYRKGVNYLRPPVKWSVQEQDGGAVDQMGRYTAPAAAGVFHIQVERTDAPGIRAVATVTVQ